MALPKVAQDLDTLVKALYTKENVEFLIQTHKDITTVAIALEGRMLHKRGISHKTFFSRIDDLDRLYPNDNYLAMEKIGEEFFNDSKIKTLEEFHASYDVAKSQVLEQFDIQVALPDPKLIMGPEHIEPWYAPKNLSAYYTRTWKNRVMQLTPAIIIPVVGIPLSIITDDPTYLLATAMSGFITIPLSYSIVQAHKEAKKFASYRSDEKQSQIYLKICYQSKITQRFRHEYTHHVEKKLQEDKDITQIPMNIKKTLGEGLATFAETEPKGTFLEMHSALWERANRIFPVKEDPLTEKDDPYFTGLSLMLVLHHKYGQDALNRLIRGDLTPLEGL